ncbi:MAG: HRDC domain-containing protein [Deltaproteobacteria bacterium]|nr:HRDC domain-containing protein [Deltaproteobacteria bacterium]
MSGLDASPLPTVIAEPRALAALGDVLGAARLLPLAVETNALGAYRPRLCLVQLEVGAAFEGGLVAIDALAFEARPSPLAALFARLPEDAALLVHGGEHTLAALRRELGVRPRHVLDTQEAAVLLGLPRTGLKALLHEYLGVTLPAPRSIDWRARPLDGEAVAHALTDVAHLRALFGVLHQKIVAADLEDELAVASALIGAARVTANIPDPKRFRTIDGASSLEPEGLHLLHALVTWRDQKARELDLPPGRLLPNALLIQLAQAPELAAERLNPNVPGLRARFHSRLVHADIEQLRRVVRVALATFGEVEATPAAEPRHPTPLASSPSSGPGAPPSGPVASPPDLPPLPKRKGPPDPATRTRLAALKAWRRDEAERRGIGHAGVLPLVALEHLAFFPESALAEVPGFGRRRAERYAAELARVLGPARKR